MAKTVTSEDLLKLEIKLKEGSQKDRHDLKGDIQKHVFQIDEFKTEQAIIKLSQKTMQKNIVEIKQDIKEGFKDIKTSFEELPKHFATKEEHQQNQRSINWIIKILWTVGGSLILGGAAFIWDKITKII